MKKYGTILIIDNVSIRPLGLIIKRRVSTKQSGFLSRKKNVFMGKSFIFKAGKKRREDLEYYLNILKKNPKNTKVHLKLAEIYQKKGEKKKAILEYQLAADILFDNDFYPQARAIYEKILKQDPSLDHIKLKIANIYKRMRFLEDASSPYGFLLESYNKLGKKIGFKIL